MFALDEKEWKTKGEIVRVEEEWRIDHSKLVKTKYLENNLEYPFYITTWPYIMRKSK